MTVSTTTPRATPTRPLLSRKARTDALWYGVLLVCLIPFGTLAWTVFLGDPGPNPIETITRTLGDWTLRFLLIGLAITPLRRITGWNGLIRFRRMIGLVAFSAVVLHLLSYVVLDYFFDWQHIWADI